MVIKHFLNSMKTLFATVHIRASILLRLSWYILKKRWKAFSPSDAGLDLDLWYIENILTDYDSQHLQTSESSWCNLVTAKGDNFILPTYSNGPVLVKSLHFRVRKSYNVTHAPYWSEVGLSWVLHLIKLKMPSKMAIKTIKFDFVAHIWAILTLL